uniref:DUF4939 domain-containing protein n=1 Tax=Denticeps clupeoides TaxID=299321 RepID=A0A8C4A0C6_9TELE
TEGQYKIERVTTFVSRSCYTLVSWPTRLQPARGHLTSLGDAAHLPDDETAVAYIITRLTGRALEWVTPLVERRDPVCLSVPAFLDRLQTVFQGETGNPDRNFLTTTSSCP